MILALTAVVVLTTSRQAHKVVSPPGPHVRRSRPRGGHDPGQSPAQPRPDGPIGRALISVKDVRPEPDESSVWFESCPISSTHLPDATSSPSSPPIRPPSEALH